MASDEEKRKTEELFLCLLVELWRPNVGCQVSWLSTPVPKNSFDLQLTISRSYANKCLPAIEHPIMWWVLWEAPVANMFAKLGVTKDVWIAVLKGAEMLIEAHPDARSKHFKLLSFIIDHFQENGNREDIYKMAMKLAPGTDGDFCFANVLRYVVTPDAPPDQRKAILQSISNLSILYSNSLMYEILQDLLVRGGIDRTTLQNFFRKVISSDDMWDDGWLEISRYSRKNLSWDETARQAFDEIMFEESSVEREFSRLDAFVLALLKEDGYNKIKMTVPLTNFAELYLRSQRIPDDLKNRAQDLAKDIEEVFKDRPEIDYKRDKAEWLFYYIRKGLDLPGLTINELVVTWSYMVANPFKCLTSTSLEKLAEYIEKSFPNQTLQLDQSQIEKLNELLNEIVGATWLPAKDMQKFLEAVAKGLPGKKDGSFATTSTLMLTAISGQNPYIVSPEILIFCCHQHAENQPIDDDAGIRAYINHVLTEISSKAPQVDLVLAKSILPLISFKHQRFCDRISAGNPDDQLKDLVAKNLLKKEFPK